MSEAPSSIDIKILEQIQADSSLSTGEFADCVDLWQSPCWRRLQRLREEFMRKIESTAEILECYSIFGERDVFVKVVVPSMDYYQRFNFRTIFNLLGVVDIQSTVTLAEVKYATTLPVRELLQGEGG